MASATTILKAVAVAGVVGGVGYAIYRSTRPAAAALPSTSTPGGPAPLPVAMKTTDPAFDKALMDGYQQGLADRSNAVDFSDAAQKNPYNAIVKGMADRYVYDTTLNALVPQQAGDSRRGATTTVHMSMDAWSDGYEAGYQGRLPRAFFTEYDVWPANLTISKTK